ncbi:hypothetical protein H0H81_010484 [Sphagnurus paluster]|uniref:Uncharacterized protein n=1 Tax=Sphagnurus paluster TaxID=117069 RepID=A0A9P7FUR2_9AGAR|nr:hypothetical protein H0H81_010484 [Sphagnurus paluster]
MAAAPTYPFAIPSLSKTVPDLPALGDLDTHVSINAGDPIDVAHLKNADLVVRKLISQLNAPEDAGVTADMVERAQVRLHAIREAHAGVAHAPGIMDGITAIRREISIIKEDVRTIKEDVRTIKEDVRTIKDHEPAEPAPIGSVPENFNRDLSTYTGRDIAKLIFFYNLDFGIVQGDDAEKRDIKVLEFLTCH